MQSGCDQRLPGYLQLIEAQREMQNLSELPCQRLLLLQMLSWAAARAREELQQALKRFLYKRHRRYTTVNPLCSIEVYILGYGLPILNKNRHRNSVSGRGTQLCV